MIYGQDLRGKRSTLYNLKRKGEFKKISVKTMYYGTENLTFLRPRIWEIVPDYIKKSNTLEKFKSKIQQ